MSVKNSAMKYICELNVHTVFSSVNIWASMCLTKTSWRNFSVAKMNVGNSIFYIKNIVTNLVLDIKSCVLKVNQQILLSLDHVLFCRHSSLNSVSSPLIVYNFNFKTHFKF